MSYHLWPKQLDVVWPPWLVLWFYSVGLVTLRCIEWLENFTPLNLVYGLLKIAFCCSCFPAIKTSPQTFLDLWQGFKITLASSPTAFYCLVWGTYWGRSEYARMGQRFAANRIVVQLCVLFLMAVTGGETSGLVHGRRRSSLPEVYHRTVER